MGVFDQIIERDGLPASLHTERVILGAMLVDPVAVVDGTAVLEVNDFSSDSHRKIYQVIVDLVEEGVPIDALTVAHALQVKKELEAIGNQSYLASLQEGLPRHLAIRNYVTIVQDKSVMRRILFACERGMNDAVDQSRRSVEILAELEETIVDLSQQRKDDALTSFADAIDEAGGIDEYTSKNFLEVEMSGIPTGLHDVDKMLGGMKEKELIIIAARPSMGKTALAVNVAQNVVIRDPGAVVLVFSIEMAKESLLKRMVASAARVNVRRATSGNYISEQDRRNITASVMDQAEKKIFIDDTNSITTLQMKAKARRLLMQEGRLDLILIDYLQIVVASGKKFGNRQEEVASISRSLKGMAKDLSVPVVALAQLSRGSEHRAGDKRPMLSDLRESGQIEQDADVVAFIHREEYYDRENEDVKGKAEFIIAKQRDGPVGIVNLAYMAEFTKFDNLSYAHNP